MIKLFTLGAVKGDKSRTPHTRCLPGVLYFSDGRVYSVSTVGQLPATGRLNLRKSRIDLALYRLYENLINLRGILVNKRIVIIVFLSR